MATLTINIDRILGNIRKLNRYLSEHDITWTLVTKMLSGNRAALERLLPDPCIKGLHSIGDSRISNLQAIKDIRPDIVTMYIKPPAVNQARNVIRYADISLNSSYRTIMELSREAERRGVVHRVVIMLELGELREGITRDRAIEFYERVFELSHIKVIGLGTNLGCMYGVEPTFDKLIQLSLYTQLIKARFNRDLELISGGSSITLPLVGKRKIPPGVNHFRVGETAFLGKSLITGNRFGGLSTNAFDFSAEIVEIEKKEVEPDGTISNANVGQTAEIRPPESRPPETYRCLVDVGKLDVELDDLTLKNRQVRFIGTTSDMTVYDLGTERGKWRVGGKLHFRPNYMAVARLMNNRYVTKHVI